VFAPELDKPLMVETDASGDGVGGVLYQGEGHSRKVVAYLSQRLKPSERDGKLAPHELEMLALVTALREWRHYLLGAPFVVYTDKSAVSCFLKQRQLSHKQARWLRDVIEYDFEVRHRPGAQNAADDALSRKPISAQEMKLLCKQALSSVCIRLSAVTRGQAKKAAQAVAGAPSS
jgi:hypothetical protein